LRRKSDKQKKPEVLGATKKGVKEGKKGYKMPRRVKGQIGEKKGLGNLKELHT